MVMVAFDVCNEVLEMMKLMLLSWSLSSYLCYLKYTFSFSATYYGL